MAAAEIAKANRLRLALNGHQPVDTSCEKAMQPTFYVWAKWDPEAGVWYTAETSIRGLVTSGETLEELRQRLMLVIPDLLEDQMPPHALLHIIAEREDELTPMAAE